MVVEYNVNTIHRCVLKLHGVITDSEVLWNPGSDWTTNDIIPPPTFGSIDMSDPLNFSGEVYMPSNTAGGGFVLYPSKPNTNVMRSVYSK